MGTIASGVLAGGESRRSSQCKAIPQVKLRRKVVRAEHTCRQPLQLREFGPSHGPSRPYSRSIQVFLNGKADDRHSKDARKDADLQSEVASSDHAAEAVHAGTSDAEEPFHIRQLREELELILKNGDKMLSATAALDSFQVPQPVAEKPAPTGPVARLAQWLVSWWCRFWAWVTSLFRWRPRGGSGPMAAGASSQANMPRPDLTQRVITTWTRFLHDRMPSLLGHPIFFGRPFPWQWGEWQPPYAPGLSASMSGLGVTAARFSSGLPTVGSLLHDVLPLPNTEITKKGGGARRRATPGTSGSVAGSPSVGSPSNGPIPGGREVDLGPLWARPMQNVHIRHDGSPSSVLVLERPPSLLLQPAALTSPSPNLDTSGRTAPTSASSRLRPGRVDDDAPLLIWPEEDHPMQEDREDSSGEDGEDDPRHFPEDPDEPGVVSLFTSFFPEEHHNDTQAPTSTSAVSIPSQGPPSPLPLHTAPSRSPVRPVNASARDHVATSRGEVAGSGGLLDEEDDDVAVLLQGQNVTSAYGRILADLSSTEPMAVTEDVGDAVLFEGLEDMHMPWAASAASLEDLDKSMVIVAVESARMVSTKSQLWRFIGEVGLSPLLAGLQKSLERQEDTQREEADLLRTQAVEALLNLMNAAKDLQVVRVAVEGRALLGRDVVSNLIDVVEAPLLLLLPKIIKPRNEEVLYRGQRAAVEVLLQTVLASDKAIQLIQEDGRLWNALLQMTAEGMYAPGSPTYVTSHRLLAAIGHNEWRAKLPGQRGLRILSFDGGGTRGVLSIALLKQVMDSVGKDVFETFDIICGTSTGGILAVLFGIEQQKIADAEQLYDKLVSKIFSSNPILQTTKLLMRQSYYDEGVWESVLKDLLGDMLMVDSMGRGPGSPRVFCASLSLKSNPASLWLWRNYNYAPDQKPKHGGSFRIRVRDALRATTAAPTFFAPLETEDAKYCDGAFLANNPTAVALNEARLLYPGVPVEVVVSIGTGYHKDDRKADVYGWEGIVNDLINCATNTEVTHETLSVFLPKSKYFRFNPRTENFPLDEIRPERLQRMKRIAREYFWDKENKERLHSLVELLRKGSGPSMPTFRSSLLQHTDSRI